METEQYIFKYLMAFAKEHIFGFAIFGLVIIFIAFLFIISKYPYLVGDVLNFMRDVGKRKKEKDVVTPIKLEKEIPAVDCAILSQCEKEFATIKKMLTDDREARVGRQDKFDIFAGEMDDVKQEIARIYAILTSHEELQMKVSQSALMDRVFNDSSKETIFMRLKAYLRLVAMKVNGRVKQKGFNLILNNKERWLDVLETMHHMNLNIVDQKYFDDTLEEINQRIFDGMMK